MEQPNFDEAQERQIKEGLASGIYKSEREARRQLLHGEDIESLSDSEVQSAEEDAHRVHREQSDKQWEEKGQVYYDAIVKNEQSGTLRLANPWDTLPDEVVHD